MLQYIEVTKIEAHPGNPRKNLGDLTELADSIKANGILQNLTVVENKSGFCGTCINFIPSCAGCERDDTKNERAPCTKYEYAGVFTVVIGHRRLAAAKAAGLMEVPCIIADMTPTQQLQTMLLENMQRCDLTPYEQACGFQMMFDLGESVTSIAEKTGFAETTVRHRMEMAKLDAKAFEKAANTGASISDYIELEKIKNVETRNKVLQSIGTKNFAWNLKNAVDNEVTTTNKQRVLDIVKTFAKPVELFDYEIHERFLCFYGFDDKTELEVPADAETTEYFYKESYYLEIYKKREITEKTEAQQNSSSENEKLMEKLNQLKEISRRMFALRYEFIKNYSNTNAKKHIGVIAEFNARMLIEDINTGYGADDQLLDILRITPPDTQQDDNDEEYTRVLDEANACAATSPERMLVLCAYCRFGDGPNENYLNYNASHHPNAELDCTYEFLTKIGYQMADEEKQMQDGSHELFKKEDAE